ncbi:ABC transporter permease [Microbacterium sp. F1-18]|jgi:oligopeptide transport system permease protein|uniref:ABC transporter permease n=1 Tax=unclassified Microbacterium TaxID=2609290 RepID=UPI000E7490E9|nr:ABC transporter permease [Microbacterium sp. AG238]RKE62959.1 oligopeptide transport system permease protein [Microbacterium sp. AG238]
MPSNLRRNQEHFVAPEEETPLQAIDAVSTDDKPRTVWSDAWQSMRRRPMFWVSAVLIVLILFVAMFPGLFSPVSPTANCQLADSNAGPRPGHIFGFTRQGCDVYARVIYGTQSSVMVGFIATLMVTIFGSVVGALAGYYGGILDAILSRVADIFFAIPTVLGAIVFMSVVPDRTPLVVALVIAVFAWPQIARIMRGAVLTAKQADYVVASIALGVSRWRVLLRHVLPNAIAPVIAVATVSLGTFIVAEATLSFLGIGLPGTVMSWGNDINSARQSLTTSPMVLIYPAAALSVTVLSFLMLGDVVRDALDPKERARR